MTDWIWRWWWLDPYLQGAVIAVSVIGGTFSAYAWYRTTVQLRRLRSFRVNGLRQSMLRTHQVTHICVWWCQVSLLMISIGLLQLPDVPVAMYADHQGGAVLVWLFLRKIERLVSSLILLTLSAYKARWLYRVA